MKDSYLITGGAGFIGTNLADHYLRHGRRVTIFDNFSRAGTRSNAHWLLERHGTCLSIVEGDIREGDERLRELSEGVDVICHLAGQVAVTTSVKEPREDFEINALGTLNVLEAVRKSSARPIVIYSSTNKVYGRMADLETVESDVRYDYASCPGGISESRALDFHSPYGCSKGTGDQYVLDYGRIYGLRTVVFRQSCVYGPHQLGGEDQGWVAWFAIQAMKQAPLVIFGNGKQVRDLLYVGDLIEAFDEAGDNIDVTAGQAYNIGGGPQNTLSLLELIAQLESHFGRRIDYSFGSWRPGEQLVYVSDVAKARTGFGWSPRTPTAAGITRLLGWLEENRSLFTDATGPPLLRTAVARD